MKLSDKIVILRKSHGMSQEELAGKLNLSRQAISRWEMGTAMPDAANVLQLSKLFAVTTDYLLNEDYSSDQDLPKIKEIKQDHRKQILIYLIVLEVMAVLMQFMTAIFLRSAFFGILSFIPFAALIGGFEYVYRKEGSEAKAVTALFRKGFYKISACLGLYFPIRLMAQMLVSFYALPVPSLVFECMVLSVYIGTAMLVILSIERSHLMKGNEMK